MPVGCENVSSHIHLVFCQLKRKQYFGGMHVDASEVYSHLKTLCSSFGTFGYRYVCRFYNNNIYFLPFGSDLHEITAFAMPSDGGRGITMKHACLPYQSVTL